MDEKALRESVHTALQAADADPRQPRMPAFEALWRTAQRGAETRSGPVAWLAPRGLASVAGAAAGVAAIATLMFFALRPNLSGELAGSSLDADLALARQIAAADPWRVPTDRLLDTAPASLASGAPSIPNFEYPLLPKERYL